MRKQARFSGYFASPLRYPGGKGRLGPWLASVIERNDLKGGWYVEPYAGGAGAALYLLQKEHVAHIVINDDDPVVHAFWMSVVHESDVFIDMIQQTPVTMESRARFQAIVAHPEKHSELERGFAAFFLNRTSRSGILAGGVIGGKGQAGDLKLDARYQRDDLIGRVRAIGALRERITVVGMDALDMLIDSSRGFPDKTLIYLDPPYYEKGTWA
jgi:DNA adenine methylase